MANCNIYIGRRNLSIVLHWRWISEKGFGEKVRNCRRNELFNACPKPYCWLWSRKSSTISWLCVHLFTRRTIHHCKVPGTKRRRIWQSEKDHCAFTRTNAASRQRYHEKKISHPRELSFRSLSRRISTFLPICAHIWSDCAMHRVLHELLCIRF